jgi:DNA-binding response OmpR family regulator
MQPRKYTILIVEDHDDTRDGLTSLLAADYTCFATGSAEAAMRLIGARYFNLVLTDIHLPDASGLEICRLVRKMSVDTVVIAMTAMSDSGYRTRALAEGTLYYIEKPFAPDKLLVWIKSALRCQALARGSRSTEHRAQTAGAN